MPIATPHVGVRTTLNRTEKQPLIVADMSTGGGVFTPGATGIDRALFPVDVPVHFTTEDAEMVAGCGTGTLRQTVDRCIAAGVTASICAVVPDILPADTLEQTMAKLVGSPSARTGAYALLAAQAECGVEPDLLIAPGYTSQRLGNAANPLATAFDGICDRLPTAMAICQTPSSSKEAAVEWAGDFSETMNIIAVGQAVRVAGADALPVTRDAAPSVLALMVKTDKARLGPYRNPGNQPLVDILGPDRAVDYTISDPDSEANWLLQRGVNCIVQLEKNRTSRSTNSPQGKQFWGFLNTCSDPLWRQIQVVRTRKAVREVIPRTMIKYAGMSLGAHLGVTILGALQDFLTELKAGREPAILGGEVRWDRSLNSNANLRVGGFVVSMDFEETPALLDLVVETGRHERSFNILADEIMAAAAQLNISGSLAA